MPAPVLEPPSRVTLTVVAERIAAIAELPARLDDLDLHLGAGHGVETLEQRFELAAERLGLDDLGRAVLAAIALHDLSPELASALAGLAPATAPGAPTARAVARLLAGPGVSVTDVLVALGSSEPLRGLGAVRLAEAPDGTALADRPLVLADRLATMLLGAAIDDPGAGELRRVEGSPLPFGRAEAIDRLAGLLGVAGARRSPVAVHGPDAALAVCAAAGRGVLCVSGAAIAEATVARDAVLAATLEDRVLVVDRLGDLQPADRAVLPDRLALLPGAVLCLAGADELPVLEEMPAVAVAIASPSASERAAIWSAALGGEVPAGISAAHRLPLSRIEDGARLAVSAALAAGRAQVAREDVELGARAASASNLGDLAITMVGEIGWEDLVLPERPLVLLRSLTAFMRHRELVLDQWGFGRRSGRAQGLVAMFAGDSGTGKTLAARVLAADLGLELFRVDLATVVSKWLGETEKNLDRVFAAAQGANAVLFFDEADAVFGRRSDVQDSHDRYANLQTAYLLQRIEQHDGPVILATNMRGNVDDAFLRRMDAVVEFPFPSAEHRRRLWDLLLPDEAPRGDDVELDFLAERFELSGGGIRNAAIAGAVLAAQDGVAIGMEQLVRGVAMEYAKLGRLTLAADFDRFHSLVRGGTGSGSARSAG